MIKNKTPYTPEEAGYAPERIDVLNRHFKKLIDCGKLQGASYCLSRNNKIFALNAMGKLTNIEGDNRPLTPQSHNIVYSITKLFCAAAIFTLVEEGLITLNQRVGEFIEEFNVQPFHDITIAHLLSHTSGLKPDPNCFENPYERYQWENIGIGYEAGEENWIKSSLKTPPRCKPGTEWAYCTFGFTILGEVISRVSGMFVHNYIKQRLLVPCEMTESGFREQLTKEHAADLCIKYDGEARTVNRVLNDIPPSKEELFWDSIPATGNGLYSTLEDLVKFGTMLMQGGIYNGKQVMGRKMVEKMTARYTTKDIKEYCYNFGGVERAYALGPDIRRNLLSLYTEGTFFHEGAGACCLMIDPFEKMVAAWFVPYSGTDWLSEALYNASAIIWSGIR